MNSLKKKCNRQCKNLKLFIWNQTKAKIRHGKVHSHAPGLSSLISYLLFVRKQVVSAGKIFHGYPLHLFVLWFCCVHSENLEWFQPLSVLIAQSCLTLCDTVDFTRLFCPRNSPGENTGVVSHFLLQTIFPTQGCNPGLLPCRWVLKHLSQTVTVSQIIKGWRIHQGPK